MIALLADVYCYKRIMTMRPAQPTEMTALRQLYSVSKSFWKNKGILICQAINMVLVNMRYQRQTLEVLWHKNS